VAATTAACRSTSAVLTPACPTSPSKAAAERLSVHTATSRPAAIVPARPAERAATAAHSAWTAIIGPGAER